MTKKEKSPQLVVNNADNKLGNPNSAGRPSGAKSKPMREDDLDAFLVELGQRVRRMRAMRGMSRKVLSQVSGMSERYIAQLESGLGNVSIMLLRRVAAAIGSPIEDLIEQNSNVHDDWPLMRPLLRQATPEMIAEVKQILTGNHAKDKQGTPRVVVDRIALVGLRGAGKSTLGRQVAEKLGWPFVELNKEIEEEHGFAMNEILALYGQDGYRRFEQATLRRIIARPGPMLLATGGGIVSEPMTYELLLNAFFTIWLKATPAEHMKRVRQQGDLRPMGNDKTAMAELINILSSREPHYSRARLMIDTSNSSIAASMNKLFNAIQSH